MPDEILQAGLENWDFSGFKTIDFFLHLIDADNVDAEFGETSSGDEADIAGADHGNMHDEILSDFSHEADGFCKNAISSPLRSARSRAKAILAWRNPALAPQSKRLPSNRNPWQAIPSSISLANESVS